MKRRLLLILASLTLVFASLSLAAAPVALADSKDAVCSGAGIATGDASGGCSSTNSATPNSLLKLAINLLSFIVGAVAIIMIIIGGLKYITSGGDSNSTASAKNTILYALVGLVIVALAQLLVRFTLTATSNAALVCPSGQHAVNGKCR